MCYHLVAVTVCTPDPAPALSVAPAAGLLSVAGGGGDGHGARLVIVQVLGLETSCRNMFIAVSTTYYLF